MGVLYMFVSDDTKSYFSPDSVEFGSKYGFWRWHAMPGAFTRWVAVEGGNWHVLRDTDDETWDDVKTRYANITGVAVTHWWSELPTADALAFLAKLAADDIDDKCIDAAHLHGAPLRLLEMWRKEKKHG